MVKEIARKEEIIQVKGKIELRKHASNL